MPNEGTIYQIKIQGKLDERWSDWFSEMTVSEMTVTFERNITTLTGPVVDQAALRGILDKIWDLNLVLVSIIQAETNTRGASQTQE